MQLSVQWEANGALSRWELHEQLSLIKPFILYPILGYFSRFWLQEEPNKAPSLDVSCVSLSPHPPTPGQTPQLCFNDLLDPLRIFFLYN